MRKTYILKLALKNITAHRLRSLLTIMGIAIGVGFIIFLISLGFGLQRISTKEIANLEALQILDVTPGKSKVIVVNNETVEKFMDLPNVTNVAVEVSQAGKLSFGTSTTEGVIYGKDTDYLKLEDAQLEKGELYGTNQKDEAVVNITTLKQLGINDFEAAIGKTIKTDINISADITKSGKVIEEKDEFTIVGVLKNESSPYIYIPLEKYKKYGVVNYTSAKVRVAKREDVDLVKKQLENMGYKVTALKETVDQINQFFSIFQLILLSFGVIAVIVAALGMFNTLTISLLEKTREISFMKVLGTTSRDIWAMFLGEALLIGFIGAIMGITGGLLLGASLNNFLVDLANQTGNKPVEIFYAPIVFIFIVFAIAILVSFLTGVYPSFRAARIDPLESMRYE